MQDGITQAIDQIGRSKNVDKEMVIEAAKRAMEAAASKFYDRNEEYVAEFDDETGRLKVFVRKEVVREVENENRQISLSEAREIDPDAELEDIILKPVPTEDFGRIAAQTAKQVIIQKVREAERENTYEKYRTKIGELVNGVVQRKERGKVVVSLGSTDAYLPEEEQLEGEKLSQGDRIKAIIKEVKDIAQGAHVILSRSDTRLVKLLFKQEVPEIYNGVVQIKNCARDAGKRTKIAVACPENEIDPVGACVGMKGYRVQSVIKELDGEKIDIIQYSQDPATYVRNALNPANINRITITDRENREMEVVIDDDQLSLAIGRGGQNVKLAARLIGWRIDIKSESEKLEEVQAEMDRMQNAKKKLQKLEGAGEKVAQLLLDEGYFGPEDIRKASLSELTELSGIGKVSAEKIKESAENMNN